MSWRDADWTRRRGIAVDASAEAGTTKDVTVVMSSDDKEFWGFIRSDGADIRVTAADGVTDLDFQLTGFDYAARTVTIEIDDATVTASSISALWIYWGNASATSPGYTFTPNAPLDGYVYYAEPRDNTVTARRMRFGDTRPLDRIVKGSAEETYLFVDFSALLLRRSVPFEGYSLYEEIEAVTFADVRDAALGPLSGLYDFTLTRLLDGGVAHWLKGGTTGTEYFTLTRVTTTLGRTLEYRTLLMVRDVTE